MADHRRETALAVGACLVAMMCFSSVPVFLRHLVGHLDAWTVNAVRYATATAFWLPSVAVLGWRFRRRRLSEPHLPRRSIWLVALVPTVPNLLGQVGWATCPYYVDAPTIGFAIRTAFLFTIALGLLFIPAERPLARKPLFFVAAALSMSGILLMYVERLVLNGLAAGAEATGLAIIVATALCWGAYAVAVRRALRGYPFRLAFGVTSLYTTAGLVVLMLVFGNYAALARLPAREWALLVVSAFLGIAFGHVLYYRGIHGIGPIVANGVTLVGPFVTAAIAAAALDERMTTVQWAGGLAVVAAGFLLIRARAQVIGNVPARYASGESGGGRRG